VNPRRLEVRVSLERRPRGTIPIGASIYVQSRGLAGVTKKFEFLPTHAVCPGAPRPWGGPSS